MGRKRRRKGGWGCLLPGCLMQGDRPSPAKAELSMSCGSAQARQTVNEIFNAVLSYHGSNASIWEREREQEKGREGEGEGCRSSVQDIEEQIKFKADLLLH